MRGIVIIRTQRTVGIWCDGHKDLVFYIITDEKPSPYVGDLVVFKIREVSSFEVPGAMTESGVWAV